MSEKTTEYVTVFANPIKLDSYFSSAVIETFKFPLYPLNEFKLIYTKRHPTIFCDFYVYGLPIPDFKIKFSKQGHQCHDTTCNSESKNSAELDLSGKTYANWSFEICYRNFASDKGLDSAFNHVNLHLQFSVPPNSTLQIPTEESAKRILLFNDPVFSDFKICAGDKIFHVSKSIVAMSSNILKLKISECFKKQEDRFVIDGFEALVVQKMLKFIYDNTVELGENIKFIEQLWLLATKYGVKKLKIKCESLMLTNTIL